MEAKLQVRVQRYGWDAASAYYEEGWRKPLAAAQATLLSLAAIASGERVIESACGSGIVTRTLAQAVGPTGQVLATDLSQSMTELTATNCADAGFSWVKTARIDAAEIDSGLGGDFDAAVCALGLMYVPDHRQAVMAMARAVKPGGRVVATVWGERKNCGWAEIFPIVDARVMSEVCPLFFATGAPGVLQHDYEAAGLRAIKELRQHEVLAFASESALVSAMLWGGPVALAVKRFTPEVLAEVESEFLASVANFREADGSYKIPGEFVTVLGWR
jgi:ubiquinone/menaquinone biosynthesis C-methylase UbiE